MKTRFVCDLQAERPEVLSAVARLGVHRSNRSRWRRGLQGVGIETAQAVQAELAREGVTVDLDYFFAPVETPTDSIGGAHGA